MALTNASFDGFNRKIPESLRFRLVRILDDCFLQIVSFNETDCIAQDDPQWSAEFLLFELIATRAIGEPNYINLGDRKEIMRSVVEEQQPHILGKHGLGRATDNVHALAQDSN